LAHVTPTVTFINHVVAVPLTQNQLDALVIFTYNVGEDAFAHSTMLQLLNAKQYTNAANQFDRWVYDKGVVSNGLVNRRKAEKALFLEV
jgi:lysozyme